MEVISSNQELRELTERNLHELRELTEEVRKLCDEGVYDLIFTTSLGHMQPTIETSAGSASLMRLPPAILMSGFRSNFVDCQQSPALFSRPSASTGALHEFPDDEI